MPTNQPVNPTRSAVIGASMRIDGEIRSNEPLVIEGEVKGSIESQQSVTIGSAASVQAQIKAREVSILGSLQGNVETSGRVAVLDKGSLIGDIRASGIAIDDGAYFKGRIDLVRHNAEAGAAPVKAAPAAN